MATDTGMAAADAPPPPPPPPPAETTHQKSADLQSSRVPPGDSAQSKGLEPPGLQPTPEFQKNLDSHTEAKAARQDSAPSRQESADLQSSRVPSAQKAEPQGLEPTPEFQKKLDDFKAEKNARQEGAGNGQQHNDQHSADLQSSRVPPTDRAAQQPTEQLAAPPADTPGNRPTESTGAQTDAETATRPAQPTDATATKPAQPADASGASRVETAQTPPAEIVGPSTQLGEKPPTRSVENSATRLTDATEPPGAVRPIETPQSRQSGIAEARPPESAEAAHAIRSDSQAARPTNTTEAVVPAPQIEIAEPADPARSPAAADLGPSTPVESVDPTNAIGTADHSRRVDKNDSPPPPESVDRMQSAAEHVEPARTAEDAATSGKPAEPAADEPDGPSPGSSSDGGRPPAPSGDAPPSGQLGGGGGDGPPSGPPVGGDNPSGGPPGNGDGARSPSDTAERLRDPVVVHTFLPPNGNERIQPRAVTGDAVPGWWQDDNGTKNPMGDYRAAVRQLATDGTPLSGAHAAFYDASTHAPAPGETLYKGRQEQESTVDGYKAGLKQALDGNGQAPSLSLDASSASSTSTIADMYANATDHASQRLGVSDGVSKVIDASAPVDPSQPVPGYELIATKSRFDADYAKEMESALRDGNTERVKQLETLHDKVADRINDVPYLEGARRANLDESVLSGDYELIGLVDSRPDHEYSRGEVSAVQPPGGEPVPPGVYAIWRPKGG